jgi:hypothetical protein
MEKYPDSEKVQQYGLHIIGGLVYRTKGNAERVEKSGSIAVTIAAMRAHPSSERLQYYGCTVLSHMSEWEEYKSLIAEAGGTSAIAFVIATKDHPKVSKCASNAMERLTRKPP